MQNKSVARQFFQTYLPKPLLKALDLKQCTLEDSSYIDNELQASFSDVVFDCPYLVKHKSHSNTSNAKVILLVEHQSTPDRLMPFRVYHYLFNLLYKHLKQRDESQSKDKLPVVYALVFYHGKQTPYPYPMCLTDCFDDVQGCTNAVNAGMHRNGDPLKIMAEIFAKPVDVIDINETHDDEIKHQQLLGIMTGALKHIWDRDITRHMVGLFERLDSVDMKDDVEQQYVLTALKYMLKKGNIDEAEPLLAAIDKLPATIRGEFMTAAEKIKELGIEIGEEQGVKKGRKEGREEERVDIAINLLKDGVDPSFVARNTGLELAVVLELKAQHQI
ncbi:MAG: Rpn family recombination-promoting nuclease/putative transposase [Psychrosphaera sp.]|nr:Rpn family recombination-promoting nuclease/putative transposase [Psychrosphaera sp.]